jgi:hypothetical protein
LSPIQFIFVASDGRLRPAWRFWISSILFVLTNDVAASLIRLGRFPLGAFESLYRPLALALALAVFAAMLRLVDRVEGNPLAAMGLGLQRRWARESLLGVALGAGMITLAVGGIAVLGEVHFSIVSEPYLVVRVLVVLWILANAAMLEEVGFRGYPFQRLVEGIGAPLAVLLFSIMFALIHVANPNAKLWGWGTFNTIFIGAVLAIAYLRSGSLWLAWGIHFGWNATLGLVFGLPVSGITQFAVAVRGTAEGPAWLTGGGYGIEASVTGAVVILIGLAAVLAITRRPATPAFHDAETTTSLTAPVPPQ